MKVVSGSDWRDAIPFETGMLLADVVPGEDTRCFACGPDSVALARTELWAYKHRHPIHHNGYVRFYCVRHLPADVRAVAPVAAARPSRSTRAAAPRHAPERTVAPKRPAPTDVVRAMCPECFIEVSATGVCGVCGTTVA